MHGPVQHHLYAHGTGSATGDVGKEIVGTGIAVEYARGALSVGHMPRAAKRTLGKQARTLLARRCQVFQPVVSLLYFLEKTVCPLLHTEEHAIHPYPLGTCQRRHFHVVGTLHDGDAHLLQSSVAALTLVGGRHEQVGLEVHYLLYVHGIARSQVANLPLGNSLLETGVPEVFRVEDATDVLRNTQFLQQCRVSGRVDGGAPYGHLHTDAPQQGGGIPWVADVYAHDISTPYGTHMPGMAQGQGVSLRGLARPAVGARTEEHARKDYRTKVFHIAIHRFIVCKFTPFSFNCFPCLVFYDIFINFARK